MSLTSLRNTVYFFFSNGENQVTIKYWSGVLAGLRWWQVKDWRKQNLYSWIKKQQNLIRTPSAEERKQVKVIKWYPINLPKFQTLHILSNISTAYLQHAVHCTQLPLPLWFTICPVYLATSTMRSYLQDTHSCCSKAPEPKQTSVSKWAMALIFLFSSIYSFLLPDEGWSP